MVVIGGVLVRGSGEVARTVVMELGFTTVALTASCVGTNSKDLLFCSAGRNSGAGAIVEVVG